MLLESDASSWYAIDVAVAAGVISVFAALFTGWQAFEAYRTRKGNEKAIQTQADALKEQADILRAQAAALGSQAEMGRISADAAKRSATAAEDSAKATRTLAETGQRAWLTFDFIQVLSRDSHEFPLAVLAHIPNGGNSPAVNIRVDGRYSILKPGEEGFACTVPPNVNRGPVGPKGILKYHIDLGQIKAELSGRVKTGELHLYVYGLIAYEDVFGNPRSLKWCAVYQHSSGLFLFPAQFGDQQVLT